VTFWREVQVRFKFAMLIIPLAGKVFLRAFPVKPWRTLQIIAFMLMALLPIFQKSTIAMGDELIGTLQREHS
jgi:hypothetical protein